MPLRKLWTLIRLYRWRCPAGIRVFHSVSPGGSSVRVVMMSKTGDYVHVFPCSWRCRRYFAWLDDSARILITADAANPLGSALADAGQHFDDEMIKASIKRKGARGC